MARWTTVSEVQKLKEKEETCCGCIEIGEGMKLIGIGMLIDPVKDLYKDYKAIQSDDWMVISLMVFSSAPKIIMAIIWL